MHELEVAAGARGARLDRRQHRRPAHRLGHRPVPDELLPDRPVHAGDPRDGRVHDRRGQLRRQGPPRELRADRPLPRPHRRHGRLRPRPQDRPRDLQDGRLRGSSRSGTRAGTASSAAASRPGQAGFADLEAYIMPKGEAAKNVSGRQEMSRPDQRVHLTSFPTSTPLRPACEAGLRCIPARAVPHRTLHKPRTPASIPSAGARRVRERRASPSQQFRGSPDHVRTLMTLDAVPQDHRFDEPRHQGRNALERSLAPHPRVVQPGAVCCRRTPTRHSTAGNIPGSRTPPRHWGR